jgi:hypothetical protein
VLQHFDQRADARRTTATCRECPELLELGDDPDDALRRIREAIERRTK